MAHKRLKKKYGFSRRSGFLLGRCNFSGAFVKQCIGSLPHSFHQLFVAHWYRWSHLDDIFGRGEWIPKKTARPKFANALNTFVFLFVWYITSLTSYDAGINIMFWNSSCIPWMYQTHKTASLLETNQTLNLGNHAASMHSSMWWNMFWHCTPGVHTKENYITTLANARDLYIGRWCKFRICQLKTATWNRFE